MNNNSSPLLQNREVQDIIALALAEDTAQNDISSKLTIPESLEAEATLTAKAEGILAGVDIFSTIFERMDKTLQVDILKRDGSWLSCGDKAATIHGNARSILAAERTAMNFICHLSGIATATALYVEAVKGTGVDIADTRKTMAGQRMLEKYAIICGGGKNHRFNLSSGILIKDNHIAVLRRSGLTLGQIVAKAVANNKLYLKIEVEVNTIEQAIEAAEAGADILLLDNMSVMDMKTVTGKLRGKVRLEASGGITIDNVRAVAETGVDIISIGALTHSARALDMSLEIE
ncbi:MAG: carboxylating nicotinate-nucleotide diphosphorylase [Dehalococcoidia bacterium]|nr:carboxylating nicotinate-nucleotide diphosphorylase [Dehalococcoidia bacterium]